MRHPAVAVGACLLLALAAGCGDRGRQVIPPGRYAYAAEHPLPGGPDTARLAGVMVVDADNPGAFGVRWEVPDLNPDPMHGARDGDALVLVAEPTYLGLIRHRITVDPQTGAIACSGEYSLTLDEDAEQVLPVQCRIGPEGAVTPELVPLLAPEEVNQPLDPDTLPVSQQPDPDQRRPR